MLVGLAKKEQGKRDVEGDGERARRGASASAHDARGAQGRRRAGGIKTAVVLYSILYEENLLLVVSKSFPRA